MGGGREGERDLDLDQLELLIFGHSLRAGHCSRVAAPSTEIALAAGRRRRGGRRRRRLEAWGCSRARSSSGGSVEEWGRSDGGGGVSCCAVAVQEKPLLLASLPHLRMGGRPGWLAPPLPPLLACSVRR
jgi:hypothetical protein